MKQDVESDVQNLVSSSGASYNPGPSMIPIAAPRTASHTAADEAFAYLTGYQINRAADVALDAGYLKLATLIGHAGETMCLGLTCNHRK